ncbi:transporter substrate-binding domain-containing protein [Vineibacter terrae]|uniref:transporter substrate-binding domain-containing protein n=1 Tax=Vineibacter terrae TaxID=2586908 RepID=UPI002E341FE9|nr:transporter substrate-binding domain-containing protein [Vineibacter terrae]HEX2886833.1 transporter substrate-binding domain-containing protein [Vineibacter terrae]
MRRILTVLLTLTLMTVAGTAAKADRFEDILKKGVVRIAVPLDVPPFGSQNQNREAEGFDVDLANMVAKALGVKLEMQQVTGANRIPFLLTDKVDIVISVMGLTPERARQIMFTAPYADTQLAVFGPKSANVTSADALGSLKVAAAKGTTQDLGLSAMNPKATIMRTEDDATAAAAYISGQADLIATNSLIVPDLAKRNPNKEFELKFTIRRSPAHMGVRMGEHNLVRWLDGFIFFNTMNGELDKLHRKWLGIPMAPLPSL